MLIADESTQIFGIFDGHGGSLVSTFASKYFHEILSNLKSYKEGNVEKALTETFYMIDNILKMDNVNSLLKTSKFSDDADIALEFLKFSPLNEAINCSLEFEKTGPDKLEDDPNSCDSKSTSSEEAKSEDSMKQRTRENSTVEIKASSENKNEFVISTYQSSTVEIDQDEAYSFGGVVVGDSNRIDEHLTTYAMGSTANVVMMKDGFCYIANVGDSMAVLYKNGKAIRLNTEHKITVVSERERILKSGSTITNNRVAGRLNLTRAIGDFMHKKNMNISYDKQAVISVPEVNRFRITSDMEFIIMGCDGIWDCVDIQKFCEYISKRLKENIPMKLILKDLFSLLLSKNVDSKIGSDNMTCLIIQFDH